MMTSCTSSGVPRMTQMYTPAHQRTAANCERRIKARNGPLGVNSAFQKNCQSKFITGYFWMLRSAWPHWVMILS